MARPHGRSSGDKRRHQYEHEQGRFQRDQHGRGVGSRHGNGNGTFRHHGGHGRGGSGSTRNRRYDDNDCYFGSDRPHHRRGGYRPQRQQYGRDDDSYRQQDAHHKHYGPPTVARNNEENGRREERPSGLSKQQSHDPPSHAGRPEDVHSVAIATGVASVPNHQRRSIDNSVVQPSVRQSNANGQSRPFAKEQGTTNGAATKSTTTHVGNDGGGGLAGLPDSPESTNRSTSSAVIEKGFFEMSYFAQLEAQIPASEDKLAFVRKLPREIFDPNEKAYSYEWSLRKYEAAKSVVRELEPTQQEDRNHRDIEKSIDSDDSDYDDIYCTAEDRIPQALKKIEAEREKLAKWIARLRTCHLLTLGFDFSLSVGGEKCYCPCHERMIAWRRLAGVTIDSVSQCKGKNAVFDKPNRLVAHLKNNSDMFHKYTLKYLEALYAGWYPDGTRHKGLEKENTEPYRKALAQEHWLRDLKLQRMKAKMEELVERERKHEVLRNELEKLKKTTADQVAMYEAKLKARNEIMSKLGVDLNDPSKSVPPSADLMFEKHQKKLNGFWKEIEKRFGLQGNKTHRRSIQVKQGFRLQECFEQWSSPKAKHEFAAILFRDITKESDVRQLLSTWQIDYEVNEVFRGAAAELREEMTSEDQGGPEAQFFSEVWRMLPTLEVSLPGHSKRLRLFESVENRSSAFIPMEDANFCRAFQGEELTAIKQKAKLYYRAIGRLFVQCICSGRHHVPREVLPKLLCNAVLRDCRPTDLDYLGRDLGCDLLSIGWNEKTIESLENVRDQAEETFIAERELWLESFREGLMVMNSKEKCVPLSYILSSMPLQNVDRLIFATHDFSANDLFSILKPVYSGNDALQKKQKTLFNAFGGSDGILQRWFNHDRSKMHQFLQFCTGQSYLPDCKSGFRITVAFENRTVEGNSSSDDRIPECHTCDPCLSLPTTAYNANVKVFEEKLVFALFHYEKYDQK